MKKSLCCLLWGIKQQQAKGSSTYVEKTLNWWTWSMLVSKSDCMNTNSNVCIVFLRTKFKKKRRAIGGFWSKFTKVLTVERLCFNVWNKKKDCIHANIQQKGNTRNCVSFFLFINHKRSEKQKKRNLQKKVKKRLEILFFIDILKLIIRGDQTKQDMKTIEILFTYIQKDTRSPDLIVCLFIYEKYWNDKRKKKIWYFETWQF